MLSYQELTHWSVALITKSNAERYAEYTIDGVSQKIAMITRNQDDKSSDDTIYYLNKSHIISPPHEVIDMTESQLNVIKNKENNKKSDTENSQETKDSSQYISGQIIRNEYRDAKNPLLLIYSIDPASAKMNNMDCPIIGFAVSFPKSNQDDSVINIGYAIQGQLLPYFENDEQLDAPIYDEN